MGVGEPDCWDGQAENTTKTGKCPISQALRGNFSNLSLKNGPLISPF